MDMNIIFESATLKHSINASLSEAATVNIERNNDSIIPESIVESVLDEIFIMESTGKDADDERLLDKLQNGVEAVIKFIQTMIKKVIEFIFPLQEYYKKNLNTFKEKLKNYRIPSDLKIKLVDYTNIQPIMADSARCTIETLIDAAFKYNDIDIEKATDEEIQNISGKDKMTAVWVAISQGVFKSIKGVTGKYGNIMNEIESVLTRTNHITSAKQIEYFVNLIPIYGKVKDKLNESISAMRKAKVGIIARIRDYRKGLRVTYVGYAHLFTKIISNIYGMIGSMCIKAAKECKKLMKMVIES